MQNNLIILLLAGILFGISNGLIPGPLLTIVISHTIQHDFKAGVKAACGSLIFGLTAVPVIICFSIQLENFKHIIEWISMVGGVYIAYLGIKQFSIKKINVNRANLARARSLRAGALANFTNPYPYTFWITVGAPLIVQANGNKLLSAILFVGVYYASLVGSKIAVALLIEKFRSVFEKWFQYVMHLLGIALLVFAYCMLKESVMQLV